MKIGFTGTQKGLTQLQVKRLRELLVTPSSGSELHHGDCVGADAEVAQLAWGFCYKIVCHPPVKRSKRAFVNAHEFREPQEYLARNRSIVDESEIVIACPRSLSEELRSGTWATIRYARNVQRPLAIVWPNGDVEFERGAYHILEGTSNGKEYQR